MKYKVSSKDVFSHSITAKKKGLVAAFLCSWALEPWSQGGGGVGGGDPASWERLAKGPSAIG